MDRRTAIIHVGTHKTGTTSLQIFFQENLDALREAGLHFAQSGKHGMLPGNHETAWELLGDAPSPRFAELLAELEASPCRAALLSSEDFSLLYARPSALETMNEGLRSIGYDPKIVLYLRPQADYAESMYVERIKQGYVRPLAVYLDTVFTTGRYIPDGSAIHLEFQYERLIKPFVRAFGRENVTVRAYESSPDPSHLFRDFISVIGAFEPSFAATPVNMRIAHPRENASLSFVQLLGTLHMKLRPDVPLPDDPLVFFHQHAPELPDALANARFALLQRSEYLRFAQVFGAGNAAIAKAYDATISFVDESDVPPSDDPLWEIARVERPIFDRCLAAWSGV